MQEGRASATALGAARYRAEHQEADGGRLFRDPLARRIVGESDRGDHVARSEAARAGMRGFIAGRARYAEDALAEAVASGTRQVIVLGAGLDTFAYRNPYPDVRVFEVDHPDTQAWKRDRLSQAGIEIPDSARLVPVDFEREDIVGALSAAGLDPALRAFVIWTGVTVYLTREAIDTTLRALGGLAPGSEVVFDYGLPVADTDDERVRAARAERERRLAAIGEQWISFFEPDEIADIVSAAGLTVVEDIPVSELARRYLGVEPRTGAAPHLVHARVSGDAEGTGDRSVEDPVGRQQVIPILRVFDHALAREFYCGLLGFEWRFEHRFDADLPVYAEVARNGSVLHLSEHHGDATPGSGVMIVVDDLDAYHRALLEHRHRNARPGIQENPWGRTMTVLDPFGNRLVFWQRR